MNKLSDEILRALQEAVPAGFSRVSDWRWVSDSRNAIRRIVEFQALKGAQYSTRWGFFIDFVPRLRPMTASDRSKRSPMPWGMLFRPICPQHTPSMTYSISLSADPGWPFVALPWQLRSDRPRLGAIAIGGRRNARGSGRLSRFCERFEIDPRTTILAKALAEAVQIKATLSGWYPELGIRCHQPC